MVLKQLWELKYNSIKPLLACLLLSSTNLSAVHGAYVQANCSKNTNVTAYNCSAVDHGTCAACTAGMPDCDYLLANNQEGDCCAHKEKCCGYQDQIAYKNCNPHNCNCYSCPYQCPYTSRDICYKSCCEDKKDKGLFSSSPFAQSYH
jgi:hypothetical protein